MDKKLKEMKAIKRFIRSRLMFKTGDDTAINELIKQYSDELSQTH